MATCPKRWGRAGGEVIPIIVEALPQSMQNSIMRFLPLQIGRTLIVGQPDAHMFGAWAGFGVLCGYAGYAVASLVVGGVLLVPGTPRAQALANRVDTGAGTRSCAQELASWVLANLSTGQSRGLGST